MIRLAFLLALLVLQAEIAAIFWGANMANQLLLEIATRPPPPPHMYSDKLPIDAWMDI